MTDVGGVFLGPELRWPHSLITFGAEFLDYQKNIWSSAIPHGVCHFDNIFYVSV